MSLWLTLGVGVFGGLGAIARFTQDTVVKSKVTSAFPWGTFTINVIGSLILGLITGLVVFGGHADAWRVLLGIGFCGGYTTFSTAMFETAALIRTGRVRTATLNLFVPVLASTAAAALGLFLGSL
ncbi:MAG: fluoride efflux transporter CrcB [Gordonia sp. (in: high G+C Gram-positive bacteria)]|uniref:fluoride efflux transporter CrcB n=1 Tax=Gordonia sp. (in: high G+C Gram-positive bacteria) TaxID=84139 RepID=UPI0039E34C5F